MGTEILGATQFLTRMTILIWYFVILTKIARLPGHWFNHTASKTKTYLQARLQKICQEMKISLLGLITDFPLNDWHIFMNIQWNGELPATMTLKEWNYFPIMCALLLRIYLFSLYSITMANVFVYSAYPLPAIHVNPVVPIWFNQMNYPCIFMERNLLNAASTSSLTMATLMISSKNTLEIIGTQIFYIHVPLLHRQLHKRGWLENTVTAYFSVMMLLLNLLHLLGIDCWLLNLV